jgi:Cobalt uptake substrate-specific transmembrane region
MHIEPGIVTGAKLMLGAVTAAGSLAVTAKLSYDFFRENGVASLVLRTVVCAVAVLFFFEILPRYPVGASEVHFIFGSTLFLLFGAVPAAFGLAIGLTLQSVFLAPIDLPQLGMNLTTLIVPLLGLHALARKVIAKDTAYVDLTYTQTLKLSLAFQGGVVAWVAFWVFFGQGFGATTFVSIGSFGAAYMLVVVIEPLVDLGLLAMAKSFRNLAGSPLFANRLYSAG